MNRQKLDDNGVDTTIENEIDITYTWGTAATANSLKTTNIVIESYW